MKRNPSILKILSVEKGAECLWVTYSKREAKKTLVCEYKVTIHDCQKCELGDYETSDYGRSEFCPFNPEHLDNAQILSVLQEISKHKPFQVAKRNNTKKLLYWSRYIRKRKLVATPFKKHPLLWVVIDMYGKHLATT